MAEKKIDRKEAGRGDLSTAEEAFADGSGGVVGGRVVPCAASNPHLRSVSDSESEVQIGEVSEIEPSFLARAKAWHAGLGIAAKTGIVFMALMIPTVGYAIATSSSVGIPAFMSSTSAKNAENKLADMQLNFVPVEDITIGNFGGQVIREQFAKSLTAKLVSSQTLHYGWRDKDGTLAIILVPQDNIGAAGSSDIDEVSRNRMLHTYAAMTTMVAATEKAIGGVLDSCGMACMSKEAYAKMSEIREKADANPNKAKLTTYDLAALKWRLIRKMADARGVKVRLTDGESEWIKVRGMNPTAEWNAMSINDGRDFLKKLRLRTKPNVWTMSAIYYAEADDWLDKGHNQEKAVEAYRKGYQVVVSSNIQREIDVYKKDILNERPELAKQILN